MSPTQAGKLEIRDDLGYLVLYAAARCRPGAVSLGYTDKPPPVLDLLQRCAVCGQRCSDTVGELICTPHQRSKYRPTVHGLFCYWDVHNDSKETILPIVKEIATTYMAESVKVPWYIDLLNINLNNHKLETAKTKD